MSQWRNWRKQKIRRAVNKSTQKFILFRVQLEANMAAAVHFLPEGLTKAKTINAQGGNQGSQIIPLRPTTYYLYNSKFIPQPRKHKININREEGKFSRQKPRLPQDAMVGEKKTLKRLENPVGKSSSSAAAVAVGILD